MYPRTAPAKPPWLAGLNGVYVGYMGYVIHAPPSSQNQIRIAKNDQRTRPLRAAMPALAFATPLEARSLPTDGSGAAHAAGDPVASLTGTRLSAHATGS